MNIDLALHKQRVSKLAASLVIDQMDNLETKKMSDEDFGVEVKRLMQQAVKNATRIINSVDEYVS